MKQIYLNELMTKNVTDVSPETPLQLVVKKMVEFRYSCIVISQKKSPIGIITERDLTKILNTASQGIDLSLPVSNFMTSPVLTLHQNESLFDAMIISRAEKIRHIPIIDDSESLVGLVTYSDLVDSHIQIIENQANIIEQAVADRTGELNHVNQELQMLSMEDHLMKIGNRRAMEVDLGHTHNAFVRYDNPYSVLLLDIDYFKLYNDHYGHQAGDDTLKSVAQTLQSNIRGADRIYRYGGEEILLILPHTTATQAEIVAKKLVTSISNIAAPHEKSPYGIITTSCGGASILNIDKTTNGWEQLVEVADKNLYKAKESGRNISIVKE